MAVYTCCSCGAAPQPRGQKIGIGSGMRRGSNDCRDWSSSVTKKDVREASAEALRAAEERKRRQERKLLPLSVTMRSPSPPRGPQRSPWPLPCHWDLRVVEGVIVGPPAAYLLRGTTQKGMHAFGPQSQRNAPYQ